MTDRLALLLKCAEAAHNATVVAFGQTAPLFKDLNEIDRKDVLTATACALNPKIQWEGGSPCLGLFTAVARAVANALAQHQEETPDAPDTVRPCTNG
jgi:hypothetical protein